MAELGGMKTNGSNSDIFPAFGSPEDTWNTAGAVGLIGPPPSDPIYQFISSENYISSLESKLSKIKGKTSQEPSAKDIISSLKKVKEDHMNSYISNKNKNNCETRGPILTLDGESAVSYIDRRLRPERQAISDEELIQLLKDDALSKNICDDDQVIEKTDLQSEKNKDHQVASDPS